MTDGELIALAIQARENSYSPYSGYRVGAALLCKSGAVYTGCNIENAAYSPTNCAERTAFFTAVAAGEREFSAIAVVGSAAAGDERPGIAYPCGVCRQVMMEFCTPDEFRIVIGASPEHCESYLLEALLPHGFKL